MPSNEKYNKGKLRKTLAAGVIAGVMVVNVSPAVATVTDNAAGVNSTYIHKTPIHMISNSFAIDSPLDVVEFIDMPDDPVPLDEGLDQETDGGIITIGDEGVPLADIPQTGINSIDLNLLALGFSLSGLLLTIRGKKS